MDETIHEQTGFWPTDQLPYHRMNEETYRQLHNIWNYIFRHFMILTSCNMKFELLRLFSFLHFPCHSGQDTRALAKAGFYYFGEGDTAVCYCCGLWKSNWQLADVPHEIHHRRSNSCSFFRRNSEVNVPYFTTAEGGWRILEDVTRRIHARVFGPVNVRPAEFIQAQALAYVRLQRGLRIWGDEIVEISRILPSANLPRAVSSSLLRSFGVVIVQDNVHMDVDTENRVLNGVLNEPDVYSIRQTSIMFGLQLHLPVIPQQSVRTNERFSTNTIMQQNTIRSVRQRGYSRLASNILAQSFAHDEEGVDAGPNGSLQMKVLELACRSASTTCDSATKTDETYVKTAHTVIGDPPELSLISVNSAFDELAEIPGYCKNYAELDESSQREQQSLTILKTLELQEESEATMNCNSINEKISGVSYVARVCPDVARQKFSSDTGSKKNQTDYDHLRLTESDTDIEKYSSESEEGVRQQKMTASVINIHEDNLNRLPNDVQHCSPLLVRTNEDVHLEEPYPKEQGNSDDYTDEDSFRNSDKPGEPTFAEGGTLKDIGKLRRQTEMRTIDLDGTISRTKQNFKKMAGLPEKIGSKVNNMSTKENRLRSFRNNSVCASAKQLADAGFFYKGFVYKQDRCMNVITESEHQGYVDCFSCRQEFEICGLESNIWIEHTKKSNHCDYVLERKGKDFVKAVVEGNEEILQMYKDLFAVQPIRSDSLAESGNEIEKE